MGGRRKRRGWGGNPKGGGVMDGWANGANKLDGVGAGEGHEFSKDKKQIE